MRRALGAAVVAAALSACSGGADGGAANTAARPSATPSNMAPSSPPPPSCPPARGSGHWPAGVPAGLPRPPGMQVQATRDVGNGVRTVRFVTPTPLRSSVLFVVRELPRAGFTLGRGDAEPSEADAPFARGTERGLLRLVATQQCQTTWILAVIDTRQGGQAPLLPTHSPSGSPLPFG